MCYIMIAKQLKNPTKATEEKLRKILKEKADVNSDGFFLHHEDFHLRTIDDRVAAKHLAEIPLNNFIAHFRMASSGKVAQSNVHGWQEGDWMFLHNGTVSDLVDYTSTSRGKDQEKTDSLHFFEELFLQLSYTNERKDKRIVEAINATTSRHTFWGRAVLYNTKTDKMYIFGDFEAYIFGDSHIILSSTSLYLDHSKKLSSHGMDFEFSQSRIVGNVTLDGIGVIHNFSRPGFRYKYLDRLEKKSFGFNTQQTQGRHNHNPNLGSSQVIEDQYDQEWLNKAYEDDEKENRSPLPVVYVPTGVRRPDTTVKTISSETEEMAENIARATQEDDGEIEELNRFPLTEEIMNELLNIQAIYGFIGTDLKTAASLFVDEDGIHDVAQECCIASPKTCRKYVDLEQMEIATKDKQPTAISIAEFFNTRHDRVKA